MNSYKKQKPSDATGYSLEAVGTPHPIQHTPPTEAAHVSDVTDLQDCQTVSRWFCATAKRVTALAALPVALLCGFSAHAQVAPIPTGTLDAHFMTIFPARDFVSLEGYTNLVPGTTLTLEVLRAPAGGGLPVVTGHVDGIIPDTDGFAEVNHPGGLCWGIVPSLGVAVTPDIKGGDIVQVSGTKLADDPTTFLVFDPIPTPFIEQSTVADIWITQGPFLPTNSVGVVQVKGYANDPAGGGGDGRQLEPFTVDIVSPRFSNGNRIIFGTARFDNLNNRANTNWTATFTVLSDGVTALTEADVLKALEGDAGIQFIDISGNGLTTTIAGSGDQPGPFALSCNAPLDAPVLGTEAAGLFFTSTNINALETRTLSVTNTGAGVFGQLQITGMTLEGADADSFIAPTIPNGGTTVEVGANLSYAVSMQALTAGEKNATLVIHCNSRFGDVRVPLVGYVYEGARPNAAYLVVRPTSLDLGSRLVGVISAPYNVTVYNLGDATATNVAAALTGATNEFRIQGAVPTSLPVGSTGVSLGLVSQPRLVGTSTATLLVGASGVDTKTVDLYAIGLEQQTIIEPPPSTIRLASFTGRKFVAADVPPSATDTYVIQVLRHGELVSQSPPLSAVSGGVEVSHPGAPCWLNVIPDLRARDRVRLISSAGPVYQSYVADVELFASPTDPTTAVIVVNTNTIELRGRAANEDGSPMPLNQIEVELVSGSADQFRFVDGAGQNNQFQPIGARAVGAPGDGTIVRDPSRPDGFIATFTGLHNGPDDDNDIERALRRATCSANKAGDGGQITINEFGSGPEGGCITEGGGVPAVLELPTGDTILSARELLFPPRTSNATNTFDRVLNIRNPGPGDVRISGFNITGANAANFSVLGNTDILLLPGESTNITVRLRYNLGLGAKDAVLSILDNVAGTVTVALHGDVVSRVYSYLTPTPTALAFPDTAVRGTFNMLLNVKNEGQLALALGRVEFVYFEGNTTEFRLAASVPNTRRALALGVGASTNITLRYVPTRLGAAAAVMKIVYQPYASTNAPFITNSISLTGSSSTTADGFSDPPVDRLLSVFHVRDYVLCDGFKENELVNVEVQRFNPASGVYEVIGSANNILPVDDPATPTIFEGVVEINHVGATPWEGATPDIAVGDLIRAMSFDINDTDLNPTPLTRNQSYVENIEAQSGVVQVNANTVEVYGYGADFRTGLPLDLGVVECRIIPKAVRGTFTTSDSSSLRTPVEGSLIPLDAEGYHFKGVFTGLTPADMALALGADPKFLWLGRTAGAVEATHCEWNEIPGPQQPQALPMDRGELQFAGEPTQGFVSVQTDVGFSGINTGEGLPVAITVTNVGNQSLTITNVGICGAHPSEFRVLSMTPADGVLTVGAVATFQVAIAATNGGVREASLRLGHTGANSPEFNRLVGRAIGAPILTVVSPASGGLGNTITLQGTNFVAVTGVSFGAVPATSFTRVSDNVVTAVVPALTANNLYSVSITTVAGTATRANAFTMLPGAPLITSLILPSPVLAGNTVAVRGSSFTDVTTVTFGGIALPSTQFTVTSATNINVIIPTNAPASSVISVTSAGGTATSAAIAVAQPPSFAAATVAGRAATSAPARTAVTFTGANLRLVTGSTNVQSLTSVTFPGATAPLTVTAITRNANGSVTLTIPVGALAGPITVAGPAGRTVFTGFNVASTPVIRVVLGERPASATNFAAAGTFTIVNANTNQTAIGRTLSIQGAGFVNVTAVRVGGVAVSSFTVVSANEIRAVVGPRTGNGSLAVAVTSSLSRTAATRAAAVTVVGNPTVAGFTPTSGTRQGTTNAVTGRPNANVTVTISGTNLQYVNDVKLGTLSVAFTRAGTGTAQTLRFIVPANALTGAITVTTLGGTATTTTAFRAL